ncbi:hypothetical protein ABI59_20830 [Acidobacteria bacterium Mor1]|nr:hypothetical protein ABI59_20830 [Acidobacteria bacterium Mor1]
MKLNRINKMALAALVLAMALPALAGSPDRAVDRLYEAYNARSVEGMLAIYDDEAVFEDVNQRHEVAGSEALHGMLARLAGAHHEMRIEEKRRMVHENLVVVEYDYVGKLNGKVLGAAIGSDSCPDLEYVLPATSWYEVASDRIVHQRDFIDYATYIELQKKMQAAAAGDSH